MSAKSLCPHTLFSRHFPFAHLLWNHFPLSKKKVLLHLENEEYIWASFALYNNIWLKKATSQYRLIHNTYCPMTYNNSLVINRQYSNRGPHDYHWAKELLLSSAFVAFMLPKHNEFLTILWHYPSRKTVQLYMKHNR